MLRSINRQTLKGILLGILSLFFSSSFANAKNPAQQVEYLLKIYVSARHLDYSSLKGFLHSMCRQSADHTVGHAWIYLEGKTGEERVSLEGGHSGELGAICPKYLDGIMNYMDYGCVNPKRGQSICLGKEPNPIKYLWETLEDGFFQKGCGGHKPTFALAIPLTKQQFEQIKRYTESYDYRHYALVGNQCCTFAVQIAALAGLDLECMITVPIAQRLYFGGRHMVLWQDPFYSSITFASPDVLEASMRKAARRRQGIYNLSEKNY